MADKRDTDLPLVPGADASGGLSFFETTFWNPFFDDSVQDILKTRKELNYKLPKQPKNGTNSLLLAWPILAYKDTAALTYRVPKYWQDPFFGTFYDWDAEFISSLLAAVTRYVKLPESEWNLRRAIVECPRVFQSEETIHKLAYGNIPPEGLSLFEPYSWQEISNMIAENLPHLKETNSSLQPDNLRKGVFNKERRRRQSILNDWEENFNAANRTAIPDDLSLLPCTPHQSYYKEPSQNPSPKRPKRSDAS